MSSKKSPRKKSPAKKNAPVPLRIIAGKWRGSKLAFSDAEGLRPTPARVRETLFNWLAAQLHDAHCLDLFAGSGALSFEALSRGAALACALDCSREATAAMLAAGQRLQANDLQVVCADALSWLQRQQPYSRGFNIVFLDPPFSSDLLQESVRALGASTLLANGAHIYVEQSLQSDLPAVPVSWQLCKNRAAGSVRYLLYRHQIGPENQPGPP